MSSKEDGAEPGAARELGELLLEFGVALNRHGIYPEGHPSLADSERLVLDRLSPLLRDRPSISIGVARRQLVIEGVATDERHPVLRSVAERLHRQHLGAITIERGVTEEELRAVLMLIAVEAEQLADPLGLGDPQRLRAWRHIRLYPMTYDQLELIEGEEGDGGGGYEDGAASQLWLGLARAAVALEDAPVAEPGDARRATVSVAGMDAETVAQAINDHPAAPAYDQVIVGYLLQLATQLRSTRTSAAAPVNRRVSNLITRLEPATLQRLIEMGGDFAQRRDFVLNATETLATDSVLDVLKAAAESSQQTISNSMLRMLTKLSANANPANGARSDVADSAMREQVRELIGDWSLEDPNPGQYTQALEKMSRATAGVWSMAGAGGIATGDADADAGFPAEPLRIVQMALEVDAVGVPFWRAVRRVLAEHPVSVLLDLLDDAPQDSQAAAELWENLQSTDSIRHLLTTDPVDFHTLDRLLSRLPDDGVISLLLDCISESDSRGTRMGVFQRLSARGDAAVPAIIERLGDERWFVQRNMLAMLNEIGRTPAGFSALAHAADPLPTVRREALQLAARNVLERDRAICLALGDTDERTVLVGLRAAQDALPASAVPFALRCLESPGFSTELRLQVLRVLRNVRTPAVLEALLRIVVTGRTLLGKPKLSAATPEVVAAVIMLARSWPKETRVASVLERARGSGSEELRSAARVDGAQA